MYDVRFENLCLTFSSVELQVALDGNDFFIRSHRVELDSRQFRDEIGVILDRVNDSTELVGLSFQRDEFPLIRVEMTAELQVVAEFWSQGNKAEQSRGDQQEDPENQRECHPGKGLGPRFG